MSLDRKDIRAKLDPDMHAALGAFADIDGIDIGEYVEKVVLESLRRRIHDTNRGAERLRALGITGNRREPQAGRR